MDVPLVAIWPDSGADWKTTGFSAPRPQVWKLMPYKFNQARLHFPLDCCRKGGIVAWSNNGGAIPQSDLGSCDADADRATQLRHEVQDMQLIAGFSEQANLSGRPDPGFSTDTVKRGSVQLSGGSEWLEANAGRQFLRNWVSERLSNLSCRIFRAAAAVRDQS